MSVMNEVEIRMDTAISSKEMMNQILKTHYKNAMEAKKRGKLVCWSTSIAPQELLEAMGIITVYPENHAAAIGARKCAPELIAHTEANGYSLDLCSYARVNLAYAEVLHSEAENIPLPDVLFCSSNICHTVIKWYENLSVMLNIPLIMIDMPFNFTYELLPHNLQYVTEQIESAVAQLEQVTGEKLDPSRLRKVMEISNETSLWWRKATALAAHVPSPLKGFDLFNYMGIMVCSRGTEEGRKLFKLWYEELETKARQGAGPWPDQAETYRVLWDGIACWPHLSTTYKTLKNLGMNMVTSTYPKSWDIVYESGDIAGMAKAYTGNVFANRNLKYNVESLVEIVHRYKLDGMIFHSNRSCKLMGFRQYEVQRRITELTGIPTVIFDGDQTDPRTFSSAQYETRVQALKEMMDSKKAERSMR